MNEREPIQVTFRSAIKDGKFWTLDMEKEVHQPWYAKFIGGVGDLSSEELEYIVTSYARMHRDLGGIIMQLQSLKA